MNLGETGWIEEDEEGWVPAPQDYTSGVATTFGYNDPIDNGIGAWGTRTNNPDIVGVSLPVSTTRAYFGDPNKAKDALVEVFNPSTGKTIQAPIVDKGPAEWVVARQGPTIDLTEGARRALGAGGKTPMQWKIIGQVPEEGWEPAPEEEGWVEAPGQEDIDHGKEVPKAIALTDDELRQRARAGTPGEDLEHAPIEYGLQKVQRASAPIDIAARYDPSKPLGEKQQPIPVRPAYLPDEQIKGKMVKLHTTDPASGEAIEEETDAVTAQNFVKGSIDTYSMLMDCLLKS